jgi:DNA-binding CsgD family transcriptional regulator
MTHFSPRERDILHLVADLKDRAEIEALLDISTSTVRTYLERLYEKAEVCSYPRLIRYALEHGYGCRFQLATQVCSTEVRLADQLIAKRVTRKVVIHARMHNKKLVIERIN